MNSRKVISLINRVIGNLSHAWASYTVVQKFEGKLC